MVDNEITKNSVLSKTKIDNSFKAKQKKNWKQNIRVNRLLYKAYLNGKRAIQIFQEIQIFRIIVIYNEM